MKASLSGDVTDVGAGTAVGAVALAPLPRLVMDAVWKLSMS